MSICIPKEKVEKIKEQLRKGEIGPAEISKMLPKEKEALKAILEEVVSGNLGLKLKAEEIQEIGTRAKKIDAAQKKLGEDLGDTSKVKENVEFFKAKKEMDDYLLSRTPSNNLKVLTGTIGRGVMLASVKSPLLNIASNMEVGFTEALGRRIAEGRIKGTDNTMAVDFVKMANKIYQETGYDISRMTDLKDTGAGGTRVLGDTTHAEGPGIIRKSGRVVEDLVFKQLMGAPDVVFAATHFADSVNINSLKVAKGDKAKAKEFMADSMKLEPKTEEGKILRAQGILDAQTATWTNNSWASNVSQGIRRIINDVSGDLRLGDYLLPFVKTPANVISTSMDYAGLGIPKAIFETVHAFRNGRLGSKEHLQNVSRDLVRSGLGLTAALIFTAQLGDNDFVGAYDPARAQIESLRNSNYNAFRVGDKWVSTDWLGPLSVPVTAMMYSRKYGKTKGERTFQYGKGVLSSALQIPGVSDLVDTVKTNSYKKNQSLDEATGEAIDYITSEAYSRLVPSISSDVAKAIDPYVRQANGNLDRIKAKVPFLSKTLPAKTDIFGEPVKGESAISDILFGARVKTDKESPVVKEVSNVSQEVDKGISFTDWAKSSSKTLDQFKKKVGDEKFEEAKKKYGQELHRQLELTFEKPTYQKLNAEDKLKVINGKDADVMEKIFRQYGFRYRPTLTPKIPKNL